MRRRRSSGPGTGKGVQRYRERVAEREHMLNTLTRAHGLAQAVEGVLALVYIAGVALIHRSGWGTGLRAVAALGGLALYVWTVRVARQKAIRRADRALLQEGAEASRSLQDLRERLGVRLDDDTSRYSVRGLELRTALFTVALPIAALACALALILLD